MRIGAALNIIKTGGHADERIASIDGHDVRDYLADSGPYEVILAHGRDELRFGQDSAMKLKFAGFLLGAYLVF